MTIKYAGAQISSLSYVLLKYFVGDKNFSKWSQTFGRQCIYNFMMVLVMKYVLYACMCCLYLHMQLVCTYINTYMHWNFLFWPYFISHGAKAG